jgi:hypothetical protein
VHRAPLWATSAPWAVLPPSCALKEATARIHSRALNVLRELFRLPLDRQQTRLAPLARWASIALKGRRRLSCAPKGITVPTLIASSSAKRVHFKPSSVKPMPRSVSSLLHYFCFL